MKVVTVPAGKLNPAGYNPRSISDDEMGRLMASLKTFGWAEPVVARKEDNLIIGGHQRREAARRLAAEAGEDPDKAPIPTVYLEGLDDAQAKALNLALNRIGGDWDYAKLGDILRELHEMPELVTGFSEKEIDDILALTASATPPAEEAPTADEVDAQIAAQERRFVFAVEKEADAELVRGVLRRCGWTGPGNAAEALVKAMRMANAHLGDAE